VFREATVQVTKEQAQGAWQLRGTLAGEVIAPDRHELRADVKAVTKHLYEVRQDGPGWTARVVLDI
jgi:SHS2 domain-containing protein